jgi:type II secretory pathway pseudopilin PulG
MTQSCRAFTLVEILLATAILAVIGLAVAGMAIALTDGYIASEGYADAIQCGRNSIRFIESVAHKAKVVTAASSNSVVFWAQDTNGDGQINLDELTMITYDSSSRELRQVAVVFPAGLPNKSALNVNEPLSAVVDARAVAGILAASSYNTTTTLAGDVRSFNVTVSPAAPLSTRVNLEITMGSGQQTLSLDASASLRSDKTSNVGQVNGLWVLTP